MLLPQLQEEKIEEIIEDIRHLLSSSSNVLPEGLELSNYKPLPDEPLTFCESTEYEIDPEQLGDETSFPINCSACARFFTNISISTPCPNASCTIIPVTFGVQKTKPTGNGRRESYERKAYTRMTNTFFEAGKDSVEDMIASIKDGFLLDNATSGMEDPKNWGIQCMVNFAREIKDGKLTGKIFSPPIFCNIILIKCF